MDRAAVVGHPVSRSLSPIIFSYLADKFEKKLIYEKIETLDLNSVSRTNYIGWNITIPHKESIITTLDEISAEAAKIGAVNVVHYADKARGYNTDHLGVKHTLEDNGFDAKGLCLIYGAGGAAKAAIYALEKMGVKEIIICSRSKEKAEKLGYPWIEKADNLSPALIINATPLTDLFRSELGTIYFDMRYEKNKKSLGLEMLVWQALYTWEIWYHPIQDKKELKEELCRYLISI